jgi:hypothetical protein
MSLLANVQAANFDWQRRLNHEGQGEPGQIVFLQRDPATKDLIALLSVESWGYGDLDAAGVRVPPQVLYELQVPESFLTDDQVKKIAAIQHGQQRYGLVILDVGERGIFPPAGPRRFWRFWLAPLEELI